jgi:hypothetical protein
MEPEIGVRMARDLPGGVTAKAAAATIKEIMPAIELADLDPLPAPDNLDKVHEGDVYQRRMLLGANTRVGGSTEGLTSRLIRRGAEMARSTDPEALTGKLIDVVAHVANGLAAFGEKLFVMMIQMCAARIGGHQPGPSPKSRPVLIRPMAIPVAISRTNGRNAR